MPLVHRRQEGMGSCDDILWIGSLRKLAQLLHDSRDVLTFVEIFPHQAEDHHGMVVSAHHGLDRTVGIFA